MGTESSGRRTCGCVSFRTCYCRPERTVTGLSLTINWRCCGHDLMEQVGEDVVGSIANDAGGCSEGRP